MSFVVDLVSQFPGMSFGKYRGFYWTANTPYLKTLWVRVRRSPKGGAAGLPHPMIRTETPATANPAAVIYEIMENDVWGMGAPADLIDFESFSRVAQTLYDENIGIALQWTKQETAGKIIETVCQHIDATWYENPRTGLWTIKLIRDDYDPDTLFEITPDNAKLTTFQRRTWDETSNEVIVTWTNPANEKEETVTLQDIGNVAQQGAVVSTSINYFAFRDRDTAMMAAARDLRKAAAPIASAEVQMMRSAWDLSPGDCAKFTWPDRGANQVIMRITEVDYGQPGDEWITLKMSEDLFSLPRVAYTAPPGSEWVNPSAPPEPFAHTNVMTLPAYLTMRMAGLELNDNRYPEVLAAVLAATPIDDVAHFTLYEHETLANGTTEWTDGGSKQPVGLATLDEDFPAEAFTVTTAMTPIKTGDIPRAANLLVFGSGADEEQEIALVQSLDEDGAHLNRGILDTVPRAWPAGTPVYIFETDAPIIDRTPNADGELVEYKPSMLTTKGELDLADIPVIEGQMTGRPYYPARPANVQLDGEGFPDEPITLTGATANVTWARRNRRMEDTVALSWTDGDMAPENGQTTVVRVVGADGTVYAEHRGLDGTSFDLPTDSYTFESGWVEVGSERDEYESLQAFRIPVSFVPATARLLESGNDQRWTEDGEFRVLENDDSV